jgi:APA family basic amino acid/polyamine antiporter
MYFTHEDMPRSFRVPFGPWLVPILGILLCILLLINTTGGTAIRFVIWLAIGHIIYFSYGFWHSKARSWKRQDSGVSMNILVPDSPRTDVDCETIEEETYL